MRRFFAVLLFLGFSLPGPRPASAQPDPRPPATPPPRLACDDTAVLQVSALGRQALAEAVAKRHAEARKNVLAALAVAERLGCSNHRAMATVFLVQGVVAYGAGRLAAAERSWKRALGLDSSLTLPAALKDPALRSAWSAVHKRVASRRAPGQLSPGCTRDTHCKGERICDQGRCVYPRRPPPGHPGGLKPPPKREPRPRTRYGARNTVELGGTVTFFWSQQDLDNPGVDPVKYSTTSLSIEGYVGWYPIRIFVLGAYFRLPITRAKEESDTDATWGVDFGVTLAPGFSYPLLRQLFIYGEAHLGMDLQTSQTGTTSVFTVLGVFGAEAGLKIILAPHWLLRVGFRPVYRFGNPRTDTGVGFVSEGEFRNVRMELTLGFAGFF